MRRGSAVGFIVLLAALAVVAILTMRTWLAVAPKATPILNPASGGGEGDGDASARAAPARRKELPGLQEMQQETDRHAREVKEMSEKSAE